MHTPVLLCSKADKNYILAPGPNDTFSDKLKDRILYKL